MARRGSVWAIAFLVALGCLFAPWCVRDARAAVDAATELRAVASGDSENAAAALQRLGAAADQAVLPALQALEGGELAVDAAGNAFIEHRGGSKPALPGGPARPSGALRSVDVDNTLRRALLPALAALRLSSPEHDVRLAAAEELSKRPSE
jgi:hypothetical protein